ncbi:MAG: hypothetical protein KDD45_17500, partial [Bdellovibrionales bacterium]|nr:hypothetical protein [Bdellovibrionales bacterium]
RKDVLSKMAWDKAKVQEKIELLSSEMTMVHKASQIFGWSNEVVQLAQENISTVINVLKTESVFSDLNFLLRNKKNIKLISHTMILTLMLTDMIKRLSWESNRSIEKLTFAAIMHDLSLDEELFAEKQTLLMVNDISILKSTSEGNRLLNHPTQAADIVASWPMCPSEVDTIIRQHHERPDGQGFPEELPAFKISPLAALFIMCEDLIYEVFVSSECDLKKHLSEKQGYYSREPFVGIYGTLMEVLEKINGPVSF